MERHERIIEKCNALGVDYESLRDSTKKYLDAIEEHIIEKEQMCEDGMAQVKDSKFSIVSVSEAVNCSRTTMYKDNQLLKRYIELSAAEHAEKTPQHEIEKLKEQNRELRTMVSLMEARDVEAEMMKHEVRTLKAKLKESNQEIERLHSAMKKLTAK